MQKRDAVRRQATSTARVHWASMRKGRGKRIVVEVRREREAEGLPLPTYATAGSAGMDILAAVPADAPVTIEPGQRSLIPTGLRVAVPHGYEAQVRPRSGLALKHGIGLLNAPGTVDSDFRGVIRVLLVNLGSEPFTIRRGDRIAQMVVSPVLRAELTEVETMERTLRNDGGFGSTGVSELGRGDGDAD